MNNLLNEEKEKYISNPCKYNALCWHKRNYEITNNMLVINDLEFDKDILKDYNDEIYFKVLHDFTNINKFILKDFEIVSFNDEIDDIVKIINKSYKDIKVDYNQIFDYTKNKTYDKNLWLFVKEKKTNKLVACTIGEYDDEIGEMVLEWVQVLPEYRKNNIGKLMIFEILRRCQNYASFSTVSGKVDSHSLALYLSCGYKNIEYYHILTKVNLIK